MEAVKEPRGFIRLIEIILAIFAFATICSFSSNVEISIKCDNVTIGPLKLSFSYPFSMKSSLPVKLQCKGKAFDEKLKFLYGPKSPAEFYVFVGVMAMLYTLGIFIVYVFYDDLYRKTNSLIIGDFVFTVVWTLLWLIGSSVWAQGVSDLKYYTGASQLTGELTVCKEPGVSCLEVTSGVFSGVTVSAIFGFLNFLVWGGNCWFLYKETPWFKRNEDYIPDPVQPTVSQPTSPKPLY